jgi:hypothetical protein
MMPGEDDIIFPGRNGQVLRCFEKRVFGHAGLKALSIIEINVVCELIPSLYKKDRDIFLSLLVEDYPGIASFF